MEAVPVEAEALLGEAAAALERGEWSRARASFEASLGESETPEALLGLSDALWGLGDIDGTIACAERAYALFRRRPDVGRAALAAFALYLHYRVNLGNEAAARGWLGRAARIVEEFDLAPLEGWVLLLRAHAGDDPATAARWTEEARALARRFGDADLELCALSQRGAALVQLGRLEEGMALLDEAMAASLGGECDQLRTVVYTSCNLISACSQVAEVGRVAQWIRAADGFSRRFGAPHLYTTCRVYYGAVLFATGQWAEAERQLTAALDGSRTTERALHCEALAHLAELRLAQGRLDEAERLLHGFEDHSVAACALAGVRLARGEAGAAERTLRRRLRGLEEHALPQPGSYRPAGAPRCLEAAMLLELLALALLERGAVGEARAAAEQIAELAGHTACEAIAARAARTRGRVLTAAGDTDHGGAALEQALATFTRLGLPLEAARTHLLLARLAEGRETAAEEGGAALDAFEWLGARRDADATAAFLRSLGVQAARRGPRDAGELTAREREVLALLGEGLSNRQIAERLFLTRKTVEHHVRSVLRKLGLRSRAEAAAYAVRHGRDATSV
jgi:DNA-binding NarL/FixJ family response regulator